MIVYNVLSIYHLNYNITSEIFNLNSKKILIGEGLMPRTLITHPTDLTGNGTHTREYVLFKELKADELDRLSSLTKIKILGEKQYLLSQYSPALQVFNIASGIALIERIASNGDRQVLAFIFPGDFVGLTQSEHFEYGVKCITEMQAYAFKRTEFMALAEDIPQLKKNISDIGANVLARALDQVFILGQKKAEERLCFLFLQLLERLPGATPDYIHLPMTRQDIGDYLGLTVETVSRALAKLKKEGLISIPSPHILKIEDLDGVTDLGEVE